MPWLPWIVVCVVLGVGGLAVLATLAVRVFTAVRELGSEVERSQQRLESKFAELERARAVTGRTETPATATNESPRLHYAQRQ